MEPRSLSRRPGPFCRVRAGLHVLGLLLLAAACAGVVPPRPNPPTAPLVSTTVGHIEHIAADDPACAHAQSLWQRTVEEFTRTRRVPAIPTDPAVEDCR